MLTERVDCSASRDSSEWSCEVARTRSAIVPKLREYAARDAKLPQMIDTPPEPIAYAYCSGVNPLDSSRLGLSNDAVQSLRRSRESACERCVGNVVHSTSRVYDGGRIESNCERAWCVLAYARIAVLVGYCVVMPACQPNRLLRRAGLVTTEIDVR